MTWILIVGASGGLGRAVAHALANEGHHLVLTGRDAGGPLRVLMNELETNGASAEIARLNVVDAETSAAVQKLIEDRGAPYALVYCAGIARDGLLVTMAAAAWDEVIATNLTGFFACVRPVARAMLRARQGRIVAMGSAAALRASPGQANYVASKLGLVGAVQTLARELAPRGITANVVAPGFIETPMTQTLSKNAMLANIPMRRMGRPEEVGAVVRFLVSREASYVTGQVLAVAGGADL